MQPNYYAIIPAEVRYDRELTPNAKLLYGEITALTNTTGYCYASNQYFAELYDVDKTRVSKWISSLKKRGYIDYTIDEKTSERRIVLLLVEKDKGGSEKRQAPLSKTTSPLVEKDNTPCPKGQHNNTVNNTLNNTPTTPTEIEPVVASVNLQKPLPKEPIVLPFAQANQLIEQHRADILNAPISKDRECMKYKIDVTYYDRLTNAFFDQQLSDAERKIPIEFYRIKKHFDNWMRKQVSLGNQSNYHPAHKPAPPVSGGSYRPPMGYVAPTVLSNLKSAIPD